MLAINAFMSISHCINLLQIDIMLQYIWAMCYAPLVCSHAVVAQTEVCATGL